MTLEETLLQKLAEWRPAPEGRHTLTVPDEGSGWVVQVSADRCDDIGCALWEMTLQRTTATPDGVNLTGWATSIVGQVKGLLEPLRVVEIDTTRNEALLRSHEPSQRRGSLYYYEVRLKGTREASVCRYQASHQAGRREQVSFSLTHETLSRFAADLASA